jgi:hypothetical protein
MGLLGKIKKTAKNAAQQAAGEFVEKVGKGVVKRGVHAAKISNVKRLARKAYTSPERIEEFARETSNATLKKIPKGIKQASKAGRALKNLPIEEAIKGSNFKAELERLKLPKLGGKIAIGIGSKANIALLAASLAVSNKKEDKKREAKWIAARKADEEKAKRKKDKSW